MRKTLLVWLVMLVAVGGAAAQSPQGSPGAAGLGDPLYPGLGNGGYDALHYTIELAADLESGAITATTEIEARATQDLSAFNLDFATQDFTYQAWVNGAPADHHADGRELTITPAEALPEGETFTATVDYRGVPNGSNAGVRLLSGWARYEGGVYVASEPAGASSWYPVNDHPLDKATYTFRVTVPSPYVVAANGLLQTTVDNGDGTLTYVWEAGDPTASYLTTVNIARFAVLTGEGPGGLPLRHYVPPDLVEAATFDLGRTAEMIEVFSALFGPYPFEVYGVVVADRRLPFALETQTLALFGRSIFSGDREAENVLAHELAHQWFGDSVSLARWQDIWLNEGFATYAEGLWLEHLEGRTALERWMAQVYAYLDRNDSDRFLLPPGSPTAEDLFNLNVYLRGALTLHALRLRVGDEVFFQVLRTYFARYRDGNATTQDFVAVAEAISGQDLGDLFAAWLYSSALPARPRPADEQLLRPDLPRAFIVF